MQKTSLCQVFIFIIGLLGLSKPCSARVDVQNTKKLVLPEDQSVPFWTNETSNKILPKEVKSDDSGSAVASKILDNTFSYWWETSAIKQTSLGHTADQLDKKLKTEVNLGSAGPHKTEHKISVKLLAMQALAKIEYKGWVRAGLNYDARAAKTEAELLENLSPNNDLILSHSITAAEKKSQLSLRWNW